MGASSSNKLFGIHLVMHLSVVWVCKELFTYQLVLFCSCEHSHRQRVSLGDHEDLRNHHQEASLVGHSLGSKEIQTLVFVENIRKFFMYC